MGTTNYNLPLYQDTDIPDLTNQYNNAMNIIDNSLFKNKQKTALAQSVADAAQSAAETAQSAAETAQSTATAAQSTAIAAQSAAETAQSAAESSQSAATAAQSAADAAQSAAESAIDRAGAPIMHASADTTYGVGNAANYGHVKLTDSVGASDASAGVAATPKMVESVKNTATAAQSAAETAQSTATAAQSAAETAQSTADAAQSAAKTAQSTATAAQSAADAAQTKAETAQSAAETAKLVVKSYTFEEPASDLYLNSGSMVMYRMIEQMPLNAIFFVFEFQLDDMAGSTCKLIIPSTDFYNGDTGPQQYSLTFHTIDYTIISPIIISITLDANVIVITMPKNPLKLQQGSAPTTPSNMLALLYVWSVEPSE